MFFKQIIIMVMGAGLLLLAVGTASADARKPVVKDKDQFVPHEILVKFKPGTDETAKAIVRQQLDARLVNVINSIRVEYWQLPIDTDTIEAVDLLNNMPVIDYAEPNYLYSPQLLPNDPDFNRSWYLNNTGQEINGARGRSGADISAPGAWDMETGNQDMVIAVIDSGVAFDHPDLKDNVWTNKNEIADNGLDDDNNGYVDDIHGWDFVNQDNNPSDYSKDLYGNGHGTHVAGIIAASGNNGLGTVGVMWHAKMMPLQIFDLFEDSPFNATTMNIVLAVLYAVDNGAKIINCSFGGPSFSRAQYEAYQFAEQNGALVVAAAGNDGRDNDDFPTYPASYDLENIIAVAASDESDALASYSNFGTVSVDVAAPGGSASASNIYSTTPPKREVMFADDFEDGLGRWVIGSNFENWSTAFDPDFNSTVAVDSINNYQDNESSYIKTAKMIEATNFRGLNLQFNISYQLETNYDFLNVELSEDDVQYDLIHSITGISVGQERIIVWSNDIDLDDFYLKFEMTSDGSTSYDGVCLDDISLSGINWKFTGDEYGYKSGTSMATPVVSGIAGLIWSAAPHLSAGDVKQIIIDSVDPVSALKEKIVSGGRVNAETAVKSVVAELPPEAEPDEPDTSPDDGGGDSGCFIATFYDD